MSPTTRGRIAAGATRTFTTAGSLAVPYDVVVQSGSRHFSTTGEPVAPLFLYVNFHDTHFPYHHRVDPSRSIDAPVLRSRRSRPERADDLRAMYVNTAANVDRAIGVLLDAGRRDRSDPRPASSSCRIMERACSTRAFSVTATR